MFSPPICARFRPGVPHTSSSGWPHLTLTPIDGVWGPPAIKWLEVLSLESASRAKSGIFGIFGISCCNFGNSWTVGYFFGCFRFFRLFWAFRAFRALRVLFHNSSRRRQTEVITVSQSLIILRSLSDRFILIISRSLSDRFIEVQNVPSWAAISLSPFARPS